MAAAKPRLIEQEWYWTHKGPPTPADPPPDVKADSSGWQSLSPGMRRTIWRDYERRMAPVVAAEERAEFVSRKSDVQLSARQRL